MSNKIWSFIRKNIFILLMLAWVFLLFSPWAVWLEFTSWIRLGISIIIFCTPGMLISLFLMSKRLSLMSHFTSGVALSVFLVGSLGFLGRVFHLPFEFIKPAFALVGLIALFAVSRHADSNKQLYRPKKFSAVTVVLLLSMILFGVVFSFLYRFGSDDFNYLAYLTNWQHAQPLNFHEIIFNTETLGTIRFWLAMLPMNQAFLAELSNLHGMLLLGFYLEPFLVAIAILATYHLYEDLFQSEHYAIVALLLQFTFLVLRNSVIYTGIIFFNRLSHDKAFAAFILAPIFFLAIRCLLDSFNLRSGIFAVLIGLSLTLTHPVILAFSIFIAGIYVTIVTISNKDYKKFVVIAVLMVITILPAGLTRVTQLPWLRQHIPSLGTINNKGLFDLDSALDSSNIQQRISYIEGTPFYGFNLNVIRLGTNATKDTNSLQNFFSWAYSWFYLWILGLGFLWSLFNWKKNTIAPFITATSLLVLLSAIPYTGWLIGYFVSARLLIRASWMLPVGLIGVVLFTESLKYALHKLSFNIQEQISVKQITFGVILIISIVSIGYVYGTYMYERGWQSLTDSKLVQYRSTLTTFVTLGNYIENNISSPSVFVAPIRLTKYLPGLSSKSKVVFFPYSKRRVSPDKLNSVFSQNTSLSIKQRMNILTKYDVDEILVDDVSLKNYYASYPESFYIQKIGEFWILEIQKTKP